MFILHIILFRCEYLFYGDSSVLSVTMAYAIDVRPVAYLGSAYLVYFHLSSPVDRCKVCCKPTLACGLQLLQLYQVNLVVFTLNWK